MKENWERLLSALLLFGLALAVWAASSHGQTLGNDRINMNRYVRDLLAEKQTTYLPDSAVNEILHLAHQATMLKLGEFTNIDTARIVTNQNLQVYSLNSNAISGMVAGVGRRIETDQGGGEIGFIEIDPSQIGKLGEGVIPNSYAIRGSNLLLGTVPTGGDTLMVYYVPRANTLSADTSDITLAIEDQPAMIFLAMALALFRDHQTDLGNVYLGLWANMIAAKRPTVQAVP